MRTIPDELIDASRMDHASEWKVYWRIVLPLSAPALAVLAIFAIMWRWNNFLWPLIVLSESEQLALNSFQGDLDIALVKIGAELERRSDVVAGLSTIHRMLRRPDLKLGKSR